MKTPRRSVFGSDWPAILVPPVVAKDFREEWMLLADACLDGLRSYRRHHLDARADFPQPEPATGENGLIAEDVEVREALRKLDLLSIDCNGPVGFLGRRSVRQ